MLPFRIAVLSDIHAHRVPLEAVLHDLDHHNPVNAILVAGDLTYGPSQPETVERLQDRKVLAIRGNSDLELLNFAGGRLPGYTQHLKHFSLVRWSLAHTTPDAMAFLHSLPEQRVFSHPRTAPIRLVHGSPRRINEIIHPDQDPSLLDLALSLISEPVLVFGHSHIPSSTARNGRLALNPGAVAMGIGQPCCASYAVLQWDETAGRWRSSHHRVPYSEEALRQEYVASGFLD